MPQVEPKPSIVAWPNEIFFERIRIASPEPALIHRRDSLISLIFRFLCIGKPEIAVVIQNKDECHQQQAEGGCHQTSLRGFLRRLVEGEDKRSPDSAMKGLDSNIANNLGQWLKTAVHSMRRKALQNQKIKGFYVLSWTLPKSLARNVIS